MAAQVKERKIALISGTTNNLGYNIAFRLIETIPSDVRLTLIVTSRTLPRVKECIKAIEAYNDALETPKEVDFDYLLLDFTDMVSVLGAYYELDKKYQKLDYFYICSGLGAYDGIDWLGAVKEICANPIMGVTQPHYKIQRVGVMSKDGLGMIFQANVFGPYYLIHKIKHLLQNAEKGKIVWVSSLMSKPSYLSFDDLQLVKSRESYDGSKRLMDLLHLGTYEKFNKLGIKQYLVQPGIFESISFHQYLNFITYYGMLFLFYMARWLGSPWHTVTGYVAAESAMYVTSHEDLAQDVKYGSATTRSGESYVLNQEVDATGKEDVTAYLDQLCDQWDENLKDQILKTRVI